MRLKLKKSILSLALLFIGFTLFSCVEEPYIEPVKDIFSEIRVVNLSVNVPNMKVTIDDAQPVASLGAMAIPSTTEYFDVHPGKRVFRIYDENNNLVFTNTIEISTWERTTVVFSGFYSPEELQNTFGNFEFPEGEVYKSAAPDPGTSYAYVLNGVADYDTLASRSYTVGLIPAGAAPIRFGTIPYSNVIGADSVMPAIYNFFYASDVAGDSTVVSETINANYRYFFFLYGPPNAVQVFFNEVAPPPVRNRG